MTDEQTTDNITVDVETGERSDNVPSFEIVEDRGVKYIAAEMVEEYRQHKAAELAAMQTEIDGVLEQINTIDRVEAAEERQQILADFVAKNGDDYDMSAVINFESEEEFEKVMDYLTATYQSSFGNPSAGFGAAKQPQADTEKTLFEFGRKNAARVFEQRRR